MIRARLGAATLAALAWPAAASAQNDGPPAATVFEGNHLTVGAGVVYGPTYEGSDDYTASPIPLIQGNLVGVAMTPRPGGIALDFIPDRPDSRIGFSLGPSLRVRSNRVHNIKDPVVRALGKLDTAIEVGANAGVSFYKLFNPYDSVTISSDVRWDVAGAHKGMVVAPSVSYFTPLSRGVLVNLALSAEHVDDDYADYYFTVSPAGSIASGLPAFHADGGWKSAGATVIAGLDLDGDFAIGGLSVFAIGGYTRLLGDARRTPITTVRGDPDQWLAGAGLAYTF